MGGRAVAVLTNGLNLNASWQVLTRWPRKDTIRRPNAKINGTTERACYDPAAGTTAVMPDFYYLPLVEQNQATVAATDAVFSQLGS